MDFPEGTINPARRHDETLRFLATRRSRPPKMLGTPAPDRAALSEMLKIAARVPDHGKLTPWRFVVLEKPALERLADEAAVFAATHGMEDEAAAKGIGQFAQSPLCVALIAAPLVDAKVPGIEQTLSVGAAGMQLLNAALAAGWGAAWLTGWLAHDRRFAAPAFGLAEHEWVAGLIHIGTEAKAPPERPRPDLNTIVTWVEA
ncbi:nitroreductase family protein [Rhodobacter maris]|uniref:Putative NAD(P)H nitroreductase n=1 Tax=Rhodobacter maris TaxID=446682 RepID=A0A285RP41_9RHOB|nr:nitroreductase family protein [Rhodobacter maris]SOB94087.1 nitroreductase [Rhodobacter maris]